VATVTDSWTVRPTAATGLPGDEPIEVAAAEVSARDRPTVTSVVIDRGRAIEVVVGGWRFELEVEETRRAELRRRARRDRAEGVTGHAGDVRAMIPGRVVAVTVAAGDRVIAGQPLLVVEAMKMQNEVRSPVAGVVDRVDVGAGQTIELGDLLAVVGRGEDP
jgi:biotin carboxyl carrier protein